MASGSRFTVFPISHYSTPALHAAFCILHALSVAAVYTVILLLYTSVVPSDGVRPFSMLDPEWLNRYAWYFLPAPTLFAFFSATGATIVSVRSYLRRLVADCALFLVPFLVTAVYARLHSARLRDETLQYFVVGLISSALCCYISTLLPEVFRTTASTSIVRGRRVKSMVEAIESGNGRSALEAGVRPLPWGGRTFTELQSPHFAVLGMTGSGKTHLQRMLMRAVLTPPNYPGALGSSPRALLYDLKGDMVPTLRGLGLTDIKTLHPNDRRSYAWDIAADVQDPLTADALAHVLVPREKGPAQHEFFDTAVRLLLRGVLSGLHRLAPGRWGLHDVLQAFQRDEHLELLLRDNPADRSVFERFLRGDPRTVSNTYASIQSRIGCYSTVAALWEHARRSGSSVSVASWLESRGALVLPSDPALSGSLDRLMRAFFRTAANQLTSHQREGAVDETWVFLDEARFLGVEDGLPAVLNLGRSKGVHVVLGFQNIDGLIEAFGGQYQPNDILEQCGNLAVLRLQSPTSTEWAGKMFGDQELWENEYSRTFGGSQGSTSTTSARLRTRRAILPSEFSELPLATKEQGISGVFLMPEHGAWRGVIPPAFIAKHLPAPYLPTTLEDPFVGFMRRDVCDQEAPAWDKARLAELGFHFHKATYHLE